MQGSREASSTGVSILDRIVAWKRQEVDNLRVASGALEDSAAAAPPPRNFLGALTDTPEVALIAEVKRRSPGAGDIRPGLDPRDLAEAYERGGASAISVLTDSEFFGGTLDDLRAVRSRVGLPILRKDFVLDPIQLTEARAAGADAILLIVRILDDDALRSLRRIAEDELGMTALVEAHDAGEVDRAVHAGARLIGINNRDLSTFTTDLDVTLRGLERVPDGVSVVSESGIRSPEQVVQLGAAGVDAILVGEALLRAGSPQEGAAGLSGIPSRRRSVSP